MRKTALLIFASLLAGGCTTVASVPPARCSSLIPATWATGIDGASLPDGDALSDWQKAFVAQSGQLSKANGRTADVISIVGGCETLINKARP